MSFLLTTNRKSLVGFQNMRSDLKFGAPLRWNRHDVISGYRKTPLLCYETVCTIVSIRQLYCMYGCMRCSTAGFTRSF